MSRSKRLPYVTAEDLTLLFGYSCVQSTLRALRSQALPLPTYKVRGRVVVDREAVRVFFAEQRAIALAKVNEELESHE